MQIFRLMAMPDKVIAFKDLPESMVEGFEMSRADGFPRYWKEWMGKKTKVTVIPPEKDMLTGQVRRFDPIKEEEPFFYLVDWNLEPVVEKWKEVCAYVKTHVSKETRLMERIEDMAVPLAPNKTDGVSIEPEEVPVIEIIQDEAEKEGKTETPSKDVFRCQEEGCESYFDKKNGLRMHTMKRHKKELASV